MNRIDSHRQELERRRIELRHEIYQYTFSALGVDYLGRSVGDWCRMQRAPLEAELKAVEAELRSLGRSARPSMSRLDAWAWTFLVGFFASILVIGGPLVAIADGDFVAGGWMFVAGLVVAFATVITKEILVDGDRLS